MGRAAWRVHSRSSCHDRWPHALQPAPPLCAQVLTTYSLLPWPRSPAMQLCAILVLYAYYRCTLHLESWIVRGIDIPAAPCSPAAAHPVVLVLHAIVWLLSPAGRALLHLFLFMIFDKWMLHQLSNVAARCVPVDLTFRP